MHSSDTTPDYSDLFRATKELALELDKLSAMGKPVAAARTIKEFDSDRRKNALSKAVLKAFKGGADSTGKAEHIARASEEYESTMKKLSGDYQNAEEKLSEWSVCMAKIESLRSIIAVHRQIAGIQ